MDHHLNGKFFVDSNSLTAHMLGLIFDVSIFINIGVYY